MAKHVNSLVKRDFEMLADFRYQMRRFARFSENLVRKNGMTPLQYLLLLQIKGFPGRDWATVGELAERLQAQHHGAVSLISRCESANLVVRCPSKTDKRQVEVRLTKLGEELVDRLARMHRDQLLSLQGRFMVPDFAAFSKE